MEQKPKPSVTIPKTKLGQPGASYQLHVHGGEKGQAPTLSVALQDNYRVVLTLSRAIGESQGLTFEAGLMGDSYVHFAKPKGERAAADADQMVIFCAHGNTRVELRGIANEQGRLGKVSFELPAASFHEAETIALDAAFPFLSGLAFNLDIPLRVTQMDVTK